MQGIILKIRNFQKKASLLLGPLLTLYMSEEHLESKFGRTKNEKPLSQIFDGSFEVENLQYQGISFVERFDANSYLY